MLDHSGRRLVELEHEACGRIEIEQVRVRELFALKHRGGAEPARRILRIPRRGLVGILAVAEITDFRQPRRQNGRRSVGSRTSEATRTGRHGREGGRNCGVVAPGVFERLARQLETELRRRPVRPVELHQYG